MQLQNLSRSQKIEYIQILEAKAVLAANIKYKTVYESFYDWQLEFVASTADHHESCLIAANQIGKTYLGTCMDAMHLLGDYPDNWPGHKFSHAPLVWGLGYSMEKCRDLLQKAIFGTLSNGQFSGGLVPKDRIISYESATGIPNACRTVKVKHVGGVAIMQFWSYTQGQHAIMGDVVDWVHIDEEPKDQTIRPQVITRTINGDKGKGGKIIYTFTPENGSTDLVIKFRDDASSSQFYMQKGWDHAPHMTEEKQKRLLEQYPEHQRDMRSKGEPMLGHGRIYDIGEEFVTCEPFDIPDHFFVMNGMDFGWDHPQSHIQLVEDRDSGIFTVTKAYKASKVSAQDAWGVVKSWNQGIPTAWPADGLQERDQTGNKAKPYREAGFKMLPSHATWPDVQDGKGGVKTGGVSVETGLYEINDLLRTGRIKFVRGLFDLFDEFRQYHRDDKGKIVKVRDDILDAIRYAYMMRRYSVTMGSTKIIKPKFIMPQPLKTYGGR